MHDCYVRICEQLFRSVGLVYSPAMNNHTDYTPGQYQVIALAGLLQSCQQVSSIARRGYWSEPAATTCIYSLFQFDANSVADIYDNIRSLRPGLQYLGNLLQKNIVRTDMEITRYALTLLHLERKLIKQKPILDKISQGLHAVSNEFDIGDISNTTLLSRISDVYASTVSGIPPKIQVEGNRVYLSQIHNTYRVRTMLLAGIRSAMLWRQLGGTRWGLFFHRRQILRSIAGMIEI